MRYHNPSHIRPGSAHRGPSSFAQARCHTRRAKPSPAALNPFQLRPPPALSTMVSPRVKPLLRFRVGGRQGPGAVILELSFLSWLPTRARQ